MWRPKAPHDIFQIEKGLFAEENIAPGTGWDAEIDWCLSSAKALTVFRRPAPVAAAEFFPGAGCLRSLFAEYFETVGQIAVGLNRSHS
jgi:hypothetical protein